MPISFSAGVDRKNFAEPGRLRIRPRHDLHRSAEDGRLRSVCRRICSGLQADDGGTVGATTIDEYICSIVADSAHAGAGDPVQAGLLNIPHIVVSETQADPRYHAAAKSQASHAKIDSHLVTVRLHHLRQVHSGLSQRCEFSLRDGRPCRHHLSRCEVRPRSVVVEEVGQERVVRESSRRSRSPTFADYCNHCGNCDTFCPEYDGPYLMKPSFFGSRDAFEAGAPHDGFLVERASSRDGTPQPLVMRARIAGAEYTLTRLPQDGGFLFDDGQVTLQFAAGQPIGLASDSPCPTSPRRVDLGHFHALAALLVGITSPGRVHAVNVPLLARAGSR